MSVQQLIDRWSEASWWDYIATCLLVAAHLAVIRSFDAGDFLSWIDTSQRTSVYGTAAGVVSAIGGLSSIAISIYLSSNGTRLRAVRRNYPEEMRRNWKSLLVATALICFNCLVAQMLDKKDDPHSARFIFEFAITLGVIRFMRLLWLFDEMMKLNDSDSNDTPPESAPAFDPSWRLRRRRNP